MITKQVLILQFFQHQLHFLKKQFDRRFTVRFISGIVAFFMFGLNGQAQFGFLNDSQNSEPPVKWTFNSKQLSDEEFELQFTAHCKEGWHIYSHNKIEGSPINPTTISYKQSNAFEVISDLKANRTAQQGFDEFLKTKYEYFEGEVTFIQKIKLIAPKAYINGYIDAQACNDQQCLPNADEFNFELEKTTKSTGKTTSAVNSDKEIQQARQKTNPKQEPVDTSLATVQKELPIHDTSAATNIVTDKSGNTRIDGNDNVGNKDIYAAVNASSETDGQSMWWIFIFGFLSGLIALLTPCVFPMIPMTVSFFMKNEKKGSGLKNALIYGFSIVILYVSLGLLITGIFGAESLTAIAANAWLNLGFFVLLVIFAVSFFGAFEITLPSSWANYFDQKSNQTSGFISIFFMAFTLAIVSFSCTGPLIGGLIVEAVSQGNFFGPAAGMTGFALAIALPFTLFALFPSWLNSLPKSGGWLNVVKVSIGFIELAFSLKFLSTADLAKHWGLLPREAFVSLWVVIFALFGMYMLGKIKFPHDSDSKHVSIPRFFIGLSSLAFAVYMLPGLWGAPLKAISAFAPPMSTQDFDLYTPALTASINQHTNSSTNNSEIPDDRINSDIFHSPYGIKSFFDYEEGMNFAKKANKPVFIDFTGQACTNCRQMEAAVWSDPQALSMLMNDYIVISLYTDDQSLLPESEQKVIEVNGKNKRIRTIGNKWSLFQIKKFGTTSLPSYFILDNDGNLLINHSFGFERDAPKFVQFLQDGLNKYRQQH